MKLFLSIVLFIQVLLVKCNPKKEQEGWNFINQYNKQERMRKTVESLAKWTYDSYQTEINLRNMQKTFAMNANTRRTVWASNAIDWKKFEDADLKRQFWINSNLGPLVLDNTSYVKLQNIIVEMKNFYHNSTICDYKIKTKCDLHVQDIEEIFRTHNAPRYEPLLKYLWKQWKSIGLKIKPLFEQYVDLLNRAAELNNLRDAGKQWGILYENPQPFKFFGQIFLDLAPLYYQIHAHVRYRLNKIYENIVSNTGPIPSHILGNLWANSWENIAFLTLPYPNIKQEDPTPEMIKQNYTISKIFKTSEEFIKSIGMDPPSFTKIKMHLSKGSCAPTTVDFFNGTYGLKYCEGKRITKADLINVHHVVGHILYYSYYKNKPICYKDGANPGFYEAVASSFANFGTTRSRLIKMGLLKNTAVNNHTLINELYTIALKKIVSMYSAFTLDMWRLNVFSGKFNSKNYNCKWWQLRHKIQGVEPPIDRSDIDFDLGSIYYVVADEPYIRYFMSTVIQYQIHKTLCKLAKHPSGIPLHECDITGNKVVGLYLGRLLKLGSSMPWQHAMAIFSEEKEIGANAILEYFKPLQDWFTQNNKEYEFDWGGSRTTCRNVKQEIMKATKSTTFQPFS